MLMLILVTGAVFYVFYFISMLNLLLYLKDIRVSLINEAYRQNNNSNNSDYYFNEDYSEWKNKNSSIDISLYEKKKKAYLKNLGFKEMPTSEKELKEAYRKAAKKHHPDLGGNQDNFTKIKDSYEFLLNELD